RQLALHREAATVVGELQATRAKRDRMAAEDLVVDVLANLIAVLVAQRLWPMGPLAHLKRTRVRAESERGLRRVLGEREGRLPLPDLDDEIVARLRCHSLAV